MTIFTIGAELEKLGKRATINGKVLQQLNEVFGLSKDRWLFVNDYYGVDEVCFFNDCIYVTCYLGSIFSKKIFYYGRNNWGNNNIEMTDAQMQKVFDFGISMIVKRKKEIAISKTIDYDKFLENAIDICNKHLEEKKADNKSRYCTQSCIAILTKGNSYSDKRVADTILIKDNCGQIGYIKISQNEFGEINLYYTLIGYSHGHQKIKEDAYSKQILIGIIDWMLD